MTLSFDAQFDAIFRDNKEFAQTPSVVSLPAGKQNATGPSVTEMYDPQPKTLYVGRITEQSTQYRGNRSKSI